MCKRLKKGDMFPMRIAASILYANVYARLDEERKQNAQRKIQKLIADDTPMVRLGAAQSLAVLCHHLDETKLVEYLLPLLKELL